MSGGDWLDGTGHPARHGFTRCVRCETWRRDVMRMGVGGPECADVAWCSAEVARKGAGGPASAIPAPSEGPSVGAGLEVAQAGTGLDANGDAL